MAIPEPGEIYWLPPEEGSHDPKDARPHVVLSPSEENHAVVNLAFASSSGVQAHAFHAPHIVVDTTSSTFPLTGFDRATYVYSSRLAVTELREVPNRAGGRLVDEFPELRDRQLPRAVGLGTGACGSPGAAQRSRRGQIARFTDDFADMIGIRHGVVVSWPPYSLHDQVQNVVPICDDREFEVVPPCFLVLGSHSWLKQLGWNGGALFFVPLVQGAFDGGPGADPRDKDIESYLPFPVDAATMESLDRALASRLFGSRLEDVLGVGYSER
jgi:mRNA-degrading endonuclease toxin of MazEF toxin-antitoxin module